MKQASGLLGTRGCPGLTISKPKKLKVRSKAAAEETEIRLSQNSCPQSGPRVWRPRRESWTPWAPPPCLASPSSHPWRIWGRQSTYLDHRGSCGSKWRRGQHGAALQQTQEELRSWSSSIRSCPPTPLPGPQPDSSTSVWTPISPRSNPGSPKALQTLVADHSKGNS